MNLKYMNILRTVGVAGIIMSLLWAVYGCSGESNPADTGNQSPVIHGVVAGQSDLKPVSLTTLVCYATDAKNDDLTYLWSADFGTFPAGSDGASVRWESPAAEGEYTVRVQVSDGLNVVEGSVSVRVSSAGGLGEYDFEIGASGQFVTMIRIDPGAFEMGSADDETGADANEFPRHTVNIENGFWIGKYEVTQSLWEAVTDTCPAFFKGADNPVENISWDDIHTFIDTLNGMEDAPVWRLPSEPGPRRDSPGGMTADMLRWTCGL